MAQYKLKRKIDQNGNTEEIELQSVAVATNTKPGTVKSGNDITVSSDGSVDVVKDSHDHTAATIKKNYDDCITDGIFPINVPKNDFARANRLAFLPEQCSLFEYTNDGVTWTEYPAEKSAKISFFSGLNTTIKLGGPEGTEDDLFGLNSKLRITIDAWGFDGTSNERYFGRWNNTMIWFSYNGHTCVMDIETAPINAPNDFTYIKQDIPLGGWSGPNDIHHPNITYGGGSNQGNQIRRVRFTFRITKIGTSSSATKPTALSMRAYSDSVWTAANELMNKDHLYKWTWAKSAIFPNRVEAVEFQGKGEKLTNVNAAKLNGKADTAFATEAQGKKADDTAAKIPGIESNITKAQNTANEALMIAKGKSQAKTFNTKAELDAWLAVAANKATLNIGDNLYIKAKGEPDYWWDGTGLQELESEKPALDDYIEKNPAIPAQTVSKIYKITHDADGLITGSSPASMGDLGISNDFSDDEKAKLQGIAAGAEVNVQSDWNATDANSDAYIKNKPTIPDSIDGLKGGTVDGEILSSVDGVTQFRSRAAVSMVPYGTPIASGADLNTIEYLKVGNYYCGSHITAETLINCPTDGRGFMMQVYSPISTNIDNEETNAWVYRLRRIFTHLGKSWLQYAYSSATAGQFTFSEWVPEYNGFQPPILSDLAIRGAAKGQVLTATSATSAKWDFPHLLKGTDTRNTNESPDWYMSAANSGSMTIMTEFKSRAGIGIDVAMCNASYVLLTTFTSWGDESGGLPLQVATGGNKSNDAAFVMCRVGKKVNVPNSDGTTSPSNVWGEWQRLYTSINPPTAEDVGALPNDTTIAGVGVDESGNFPIAAAHVGAEPKIATKNTAFNKDFGKSAGTVCEGNDPRLSDARKADGGNADTVDGKHADDFYLKTDGAKLDKAVNDLTTKHKQDIDSLTARLDGMGETLGLIGVFSALPATGEVGDVCIVGDKEYGWAADESGIESWHEFGAGDILTKTEAANTYVPKTRTINGKALTDNIRIESADITGLDGKIANTVKYSAGQGLSNDQKANARTNIGAASQDDVNGKVAKAGDTMTGPLIIDDQVAFTSGAERQSLKARFRTGANQFGAVYFGKEGPNSGSMIRLDQTEGTARLRFRASSTKGAIVWEQPEADSTVYFDVDMLNFRKSGYLLSTQSFRPASNNARDLGTSTYKFRNLYLSGKINNLTLPNKTGTLATLDDIPDGIDETNIVHKSGAETITGEKTHQASIIIDAGSTQNKDVANKAIKFKPIGQATSPYIGYDATNQTDGTFVLMSINGADYKKGLAIGGTSGNLLWKGTKVATETDVNNKVTEVLGSLKNKLSIKDGMLVLTI